MGNVTAPDHLKQAVNIEDCGIFVAKEDIQNAIDLPTARQSPYCDLYGRGPLVQWIQIAGLGAVDPLATQNRSAGRDIAPRALEQAGAKRVAPAQWFMMNEEGDMYAPILARDYVAYRLPTRFVRERCNSNGL